MIRRLTPQSRLPGMVVLSLWRLGDPTRATAARPSNVAGLYCRSRFYFMRCGGWSMTLQLSRTLLFKVSFEMRIAMLVKRTAPSVLVYAFPLLFRPLSCALCKVQWADAYARHLTRALWRCITQLQVNNFAHPPVYKGRFRIYIRLLPECLGLCATPQPPLQPAGLLASALERVRQRSQTDGYDVQAALSVWLPGPRAIPFWFPEHLHLLGL